MLLGLGVGGPIVHGLPVVGAEPGDIHDGWDTVQGNHCMDGDFYFIGAGDRQRDRVWRKTDRVGINAEGLTRHRQSELRECAISWAISKGLCRNTAHRQTGGLRTR